MLVPPIPSDPLSPGGATPEAGAAFGARHAARAARKLGAMLELFALDDAAKATIALVAVFGVVFPALAGGLIAFAIAQAAAERQENQERRSRRQR
jgi:multisubunit Na+/H+ antiporter MnhG subunit